MASRFILPLADVGNGISPSDGAKLNFFATGTSTLKDTFSDEAATTKNPNPVIANQDGLFPEIWITGRQKVTLKDKNNKPKWEQDPVIEGMDVFSSAKVFETVADMVADTTLSLGQFISVEDYATGRGSGVLFFKVVAAATGTADGGSFIDLTGSSLQAKQNFPEVIYWKKYGVVADDSADDTTQLTAILDSGLPTFYCGGTGDIARSDELAANAAITLLADKGSIKSRTNQAKLFVATVNGVCVDGLIFDGNNLEVDGNLCFWQSGLTGWFIRNCTFQNIVGLNGVQGVASGDQYGLKVTVDNCEGELFNLTFKNISNFNKGNGDDTPLTVSAFNGGLLLFSSGGVGAKKLTADHIYCDNIFTDNIAADINNSDSDGVRITSTITTGVRMNITLTNLFCTGVQKSGLKVSKSSHLQYANLFVAGTRTDLPMIAGVRWQSSDSSNCTNLQVSGNVSRVFNLHSSNFRLTTVGYEAIDLVNDTKPAMISLQTGDGTDVTRNVVISDLQGQNLDRFINCDTSGLTDDYGFFEVAISHARVNHRADANAGASLIRRADGVTFSDVRVRDSSEKLIDALQFEGCKNIQFKDKCYFELVRQGTKFIAGGTSVFDIDFGDTEFFRPDSQQTDTVFRTVELRFDTTGAALTDIRSNGMTVSVPSYDVASNQTLIKCNLIDSILLDTRMIIRDVGVAGVLTTLQGDFDNCTIDGVTLSVPVTKTANSWAVQDTATSVNNHFTNISSDRRGANIFGDTSLIDVVSAYTTAVVDAGTGNTVGTSHVKV